MERLLNLQSINLYDKLFSSNWLSKINQWVSFKRGNASSSTCLPSCKATITACLNHVLSCQVYLYSFSNFKTTLATHFRGSGSVTPVAIVIDFGQFPETRPSSVFVSKLNERNAHPTQCRSQIDRARSVTEHMCGQNRSVWSPTAPFRSL